MNKKLITILVAVSLCTSITGCAKRNANSVTNETTVESTLISSINVSSGDSESVGEADTFIELGDNIIVDGNGATVENNKVTITSAGTYSIKGSISDGQIIVNAADEDKVYIILNGVNITCSNSAPIYVKNSKKTIISLADNTENYVTDGEFYVFENESTDEPNAAIFSKSDLIFIGNGSLNVQGKYNNGITSKDDLKIQSGSINVNALSDGIRGKDSVTIVDGNIIVNAAQDGIKSNNDTDEDKGYVLIDGGKITITSGEDGIQGERSIFVKDGDININSGGGSQNSTKKSNEDAEDGMRKNFDNNTENIQGANKTNHATIEAAKTEAATEEESTSTKAIKASTNIIIDNGTFTIDSCDDALHSNDNLVINSGSFNISSGDDAIHSDSTLTINGGNIDITKSYEGIESEVITINNGNINVVASDDGINASSNSETETSVENSHTDPKNQAAASNAVININGGYTTVNASGDGVDSNGSIYMKDGTLIVNGPTNSGNGALDYDGKFTVTGGVVVAAGSLGMVQGLSTESTQNSIKISLSSQEANTLVHVENESGEEIITFAPEKQYSSVIVSSPEIKTGSTYKVYVGGSSTGISNHGLYSDETYTKGEEIGSSQISSISTDITQEGVTVSKNMGGGQGGHGGGQQGQRGFGNKGQDTVQMPQN